MRTIWILVILLLIITLISCDNYQKELYKLNNEAVTNLVSTHAKAWETGDYLLIDSILHEDVVFAYPGRRMNKSETLMDFLDFNRTFKDTKVYVHKIIADGDDLAVEWQFASTNIKTGNRTAVSDAIIGRIKDGKIIVWKEYLDGRVSRMQASGELQLEEGEEPFPWPRKK